MRATHLAFVVAASLGLALSSGCETDNTSLFVAGNVVPQPGEEAGTCVLMPSGGEGTGWRTAPGLFNVDRGGSYEVYPEIWNQLRDNSGTVRADPNGIHIRRAEVEIQQTNGDPVSGLPQNPFSQNMSTFIPSGGKAVGGVTAIPGRYASALAGMAGGGGIGNEVVLSIKLFGETNGDTGIETEPWVWPVRLCTGDCLFFCPSGMDMAEPACNPGQDDPSPDRSLCP